MFLFGNHLLRTGFWRLFDSDFLCLLLNAGCTNFLPTSPRSSTPMTDLRHRTLVPDSKDGTRNVGPKYTYQGVG